MNQQRARRFRSARDAKNAKIIEDQIYLDLLNEGLVDPNEARVCHQIHGLLTIKTEEGGWDSNQITPGTPFMKKVSETLRYYAIERLTNDPGWKGVTVIISDASVPGEGEHKLMVCCRKVLLTKFSNISDINTVRKDIKPTRDIVFMASMLI